MKIIILGAGQVGSSVAGILANEENDITLVDIDRFKLRDLQDRLDLRTVQGHASYPDVLERAGAEDADMIVAVTNSDETNMAACQVAYTLFHTPTKIARIRASEYFESQELFAQDAMPVDVLISPEQLVTDYIGRLIETPGALQVLDFANGKVRLVGVQVQRDGLLTKRKLSELKNIFPDLDVRVAAIYRHERNVELGGDCEMQYGDEVFFVAATPQIQKLMSELRRQEKPLKRIILAGGGNIGLRLAQQLEKNYRVKVIEFNGDRANEISSRLTNSIVLYGDAASNELLLEENIENTDVFCAVTNEDQVNILSSMLAKRLGAKKVMAIIKRSAYIDLMQGGLIDIAISPELTTISGLLAHVRKGDVVVVHSLRRGAAEAIEAIAHGDRNTSKVVGRRVEEIKLPEGATIDAIVRGDDVIITHHDTMIESDDHVILFLPDKRKVREVEKLFQVGVTFI